MALYQNREFLTQMKNQAFDDVWEPGEEPVNSGIYRCVTCGDEIAANKGNPLPPQNRHQHRAGSGPIGWRLIVATEQQD